MTTSKNLNGAFGRGKERAHKRHLHFFQEYYLVSCQLKNEWAITSLLDVSPCWFYSLLPALFLGSGQNFDGQFAHKKNGLEKRC